MGQAFPTSSSKQNLDFGERLINELDDLNQKIIMAKSDILKKSEAKESYFMAKIKEQEDQLGLYREKFQEMQEHFEGKLKEAQDKCSCLTDELQLSYDQCRTLSSELMESNNQSAMLSSQLEFYQNQHNLSFPNDMKSNYHENMCVPSTDTSDLVWITQQVDNNVCVTQDPYVFLTPVYQGPTNSMGDYSQLPQQLIPTYKHSGDDTVYYGQPYYLDPNTVWFNNYEPTPDGQFYTVNPDFQYLVSEFSQPSTEKMERDHELSNELGQCTDQDQGLFTGLNERQEVQYTFMSDMTESLEECSMKFVEVTETEEQDDTSSVKEDKKQLENLSSEQKENEVQEKPKKVKRKWKRKPKH